MAMALRNLRLARSNARSYRILSDLDALDRFRDHLLLGGAYDHGRHRIHAEHSSERWIAPDRAEGPRTFSRRLSTQYRARPRRPQDVEVARQLARPARVARALSPRPGPVFAALSLAAPPGSSV